MAKTHLDRKDAQKDAQKDVVLAKVDRVKVDRVPGQRTLSLLVEGWR